MEAQLTKYKYGFENEKNERQRIEEIHNSINAVYNEKISHYKEKKRQKVSLYKEQMAKQQLEFEDMLSFTQRQEENV